MLTKRLSDLLAVDWIAHFHCFLGDYLDGNEKKLWHRIFEQSSSLPLTDLQIEILVYCDLSRRQRLWYHHLKKKISWQELREAALADGSSTNSGNAAAKSLMNIMMQMRKICNHPDLMERRDVRFSCVAPPIEPLRWPKLVFRECELD